MGNTHCVFGRYYDGLTRNCHPCEEVCYEKPRCEAICPGYWDVLYPKSTTPQPSVSTPVAEPSTSQQLVPVQVAPMWIGVVSVVVFLVIAACVICTVCHCCKRADCNYCFVEYLKKLISRLWKRNKKRQQQQQRQQQQHQHHHHHQQQQQQPAMQNVNVVAVPIPASEPWLDGRVQPQNDHDDVGAEGLPENADLLADPTVTGGSLDPGARSDDDASAVTVLFPPVREPTYSDREINIYGQSSEDLQGLQSVAQESSVHTTGTSELLTSGPY